MIDWEIQKQMIREKVEQVFADIEKRGVYRARFECEIAIDAPIDFTYTIRQFLFDVGERKEQSDGTET